MAKISDVAREAGVSEATVSRALNNHPTVGPEFVRRVQEAATRLGYRPNTIARSLRRRSTNVLALIISDVSNPFFTAITRGVEDIAQRDGYSVLLCNSDEDSEKEATYLAVAEQQQVAGVILSPHQAGSDLSRLQSASIPVVIIDRPLDQPFDSVTVNSFDGARTATAHLLDSGWKHPACITGPREATTAQQRLKGYEQALIDHGGLEPHFVHAPFRQQGGMDAAAELLDSDNPPDALFVANAQMTLGVLSELQKRGFQTGRDIGVITFDDAPWAPFINPSLSVIAQPAYDVGATATELLLERMRGDAPDGVRNVSLATTLIARESSRRHDQWPVS
jgi:LacI family transcriptional regulator